MALADLGRLSPRFALITRAAAAMVAADNDAPALFESALALPRIEDWPFELARVRLAQGERLRRMGHGRAARAKLDAALGGFRVLGAQAWAERASTELRATGPARHAAADAGATALTPQELEVARLAATGLSNREIGTRLYLSPRTVSSHLYRAFPKLGVTSRAGLRDALSARSTDTLD
jgi:DNA-binding CsgD family transcriptional regulator